MIFWTSGSAVIEAQLTEVGKQILATDPTAFKITKFSVSDDEIDYNLAEASITALNVMPPIQYPTSLRYSLITLPKGSLTLASLDLNPSSVTISGLGDVAVVISTINGTDSDNGYTIRTTNNNIVLATQIDKFNRKVSSGISNKSNARALAFESGDINNQTITVENTFIIKSRNIATTSTIEIIGNNTGVTKSLTATIYYVDYSGFTNQIKAISEL